jgi:hypothetical protein
MAWMLYLLGTVLAWRVYGLVRPPRLLRLMVAAAWPAMIGALAVDCVNWIRDDARDGRI